MKNELAQAVRKLCLAFPETEELISHGMPNYRKSHDGRWWVTDDPRYTIPAYMGHNGWLALEVTKRHNDQELRQLALESYRHFALKRMLAQLPDEG